MRFEKFHWFFFQKKQIHSSVYSRDRMVIKILRDTKKNHFDKCR